MITQGYLVKSVPDDLNVHLVKILLVDAALKEGGQWSVYQHSVVELCRGARDVDSLHLFETTEGMTFSNLELKSLSATINVFGLFLTSSEIGLW